MEGVLEKSLAEEKFEKLLLQERQALENQARLLSNSYQGARVLLSKGNDDDQFNVYGLLQNRDLLVGLEPSLSDQFDILQYFYDNNLLDVDQVLIAVNNIRSHKTMLRCVNEANKTVRELNLVQKKINASKSMSDSEKASRVLRSKLSDEEKVDVLRAMAYRSCAPSKKEKVDVTEAMVSSDLISTLRNSYAQVIEGVTPYLSKYYSKVAGLPPEMIRYYESATKIYEELKKEGREEELSGKLNYDDMRLSLSVWHAIDLRGKIDEMLKGSVQSVEQFQQVQNYLSSLSSSFETIKSLDDSFSQEKSVSGERQVYFLLDNDGKPFFDVSKFSDGEKRKVSSLLEKLHNEGMSDKDMKSHPILVPRKLPHHMYTLRASDYLVSYIPYNGDVLVLTFGDRRNIYEDSTKISEREAPLIARTIESMKSQSPAFVMAQSSFSEGLDSAVSLGVGGLVK